MGYRKNGIPHQSTQLSLSHGHSTKTAHRHCSRTTIFIQPIPKRQYIKMPSQKTFRTKVKLAKAQKQNRYVHQSWKGEIGSIAVAGGSKVVHVAAISTSGCSQTKRPEWDTMRSY